MFVKDVNLQVKTSLKKAYGLLISIEKNLQQTLTTYQLKNCLV